MINLHFLLFTDLSLPKLANMHPLLWQNEKINIALKRSFLTILTILLSTAIKPEKRIESALSMCWPLALAGGAYLLEHCSVT